MEREFPTVTIYDTEFTVDISRPEFREVKNPGNRISFNDVLDNGNHLTIMFDKTTKGAFAGEWSEMSKPGNVEVVKLPPLIELDRVGVAQMLSPRELYAIAEQINKGGVTESFGPRQLPTVKLGNDHFFVDLRLSEFRQQLIRIIVFLLISFFQPGRTLWDFSMMRQHGTPIRENQLDPL